MLSFVIPVRNEGANIARCVHSIRRFLPGGIPYEVIVLDHGSTDDTAVQAASAGARVLPSSARTIGAVRNEGVDASSGEILIFLDGDCALTEHWSRGIVDVLMRIRETPMSAAGSHPVPPPDEDVFLWRHWFVPLFQQPHTSHIGSAHLIFRREAFEALGGFDERLETGEDFDLCMRLKAADGRLLVTPHLVVEHYGFPRTWRAFFARERWHGRSAASSMGAFVRSRVAILSVVFAAGAATGIVASAWREWQIALPAWLVSLLILVASVRVKFRAAAVGTQLSALPVFATYYAARAVSLLEVLVLRAAGTRATRAGSRPGSPLPRSQGAGDRRRDSPSIRQ